MNPIQWFHDWLLERRIAKVLAQANYARENCCDECADAYLARMKGRGE